uniref:Uncharacterized protein n=1 Tax=Anguilla anguilla TaxID=7936 RepID=A0A0E9WP71_ANGAN
MVFYFCTQFCSTHTLTAKKAKETKTHDKNTLKYEISTNPIILTSTKQVLYIYSNIAYQNHYHNIYIFLGIKLQRMAGVFRRASKSLKRIDCQPTHSTVDTFSFFYLQLTY